MQNCFYILDGKNGATYILNISNKVCINNYIKFYKANSIKPKIKKRLLKSYLTILRLGNIKTTKTPKQINSFLQAKFKVSLDFNINSNCSLLISPTGDKVIVHHHDKYFQKFAIGKSYSSVTNEIEIYSQLNSSDSFLISDISDIQITSDFCSFNLSQPKFFSKNLTPPKPENLSKILVDFFSKAKLTYISWQDYITGLKQKLQTSALCDEFVLDKLNMITLDNFELPLGLVHRDFKPWNILYGNPPLIYDFEETLFNGPPLEDFYNFYIDPIVRNHKPKYILDKINSVEVRVALDDYMENLMIDIPNEHLLVTYLIERLLFWEFRKDLDTANHFKNVLKSL